MNPKAPLRKTLLTRRKALPEALYRTWSRQIVEHLLRLPEIEHARTVHMFWPMVERREVDLRPLWEALRARGKRVVLPVMASDRPPRLRHVVLEKLEDLQRHPWGVYEPTSGEEVPPEAIDVVLVPALAVDLQGYRLGYGKGFYDAFLASLKAPRILPIFSDFVLPELPHEAHDVPVDLIVTERGILYPRRNPGAAET